MLEDKVIVCDSNIPWRFNRYSKHHLMAQFAKSSRVFFVNPQVDWFEYLKRRKLGFFRRVGNEENLNIFDSLALPFRAKSEFARKADPLYFSRQVRRLLRGVKEEELILFIGNPAKIFLLDTFKNCACSVYHCSDNLSALFEGRLRERMVCWEEELISRVDLVIAASKPLLEKCLRLNPNSYLVEHGVDEGFYPISGGQGIPGDLREIKAPRIGYVGCIDRKIDFGLLEFVIKGHAEKSFVFIGPVHPKSEPGFDLLGKYRNFFHLGSRPWNVIPGYVKNFDLCLLPLVIDEFTSVMTCPLKLREYIAAGKAVVSTAIPVDEGLRLAVRIGRNKREFSSLIDAALSQAQGPEHAQRISALAKDWSWEQKAEEIGRLINGVIAQN